VGRDSKTAALVRYIAQPYTNVRAADYPNLPVNDGDTVTKFAWVFVGGKFHGQEVLPTLRDYLDHTEQLIDEAERLMDPQVTS
jgi:hypothetical protein